MNRTNTRHEIRETTNQWYLKMQSIASEERRNKEIIKELPDVLRHKQAMNDLTWVLTLIMLGILSKESRIKQETKGLAYLFKYRIEQFTDDDRGIKFAKPETVEAIGKAFTETFLLYGLANIK